MQVPFLDDAAFDGGSLDVWNTSDSFLELGAGDQEEHALLLCNYLLSTGAEAYVVLGAGIPEGLTSYVLVLEGPHPVLYNACTGRAWNRDELDRCPLTSVGCVFNDKNIWANISAASKPAELAWNLLDDKHWKPFFGKGGFAPPDSLQSTQKPRLSYARTRSVTPSTPPVFFFLRTIRTPPVFSPNSLQSTQKPRLSYARTRSVTPSTPTGILPLRTTPTPSTPPVFSPLTAEHTEAAAGLCANQARLLRPVCVVWCCSCCCLCV